jgi:hypothetical protein
MLDGIDVQSEGCLFVCDFHFTRARYANYIYPKCTTTKTRENRRIPIHITQLKIRRLGR